MNGMKIAGFALAQLMVLTAAAHADGDEVLLRYNFQEGDIFVYKTVTQTQSQVDNNHITQFKKWKVLSVEDDAATLEVSLIRIKATTSNMTGTVTFDSDKNKTTNDPFMTIYMLMLDKKYNLKVNRRGEIKALDGWSEIVAEMLRAYKKISGGGPQASVGLKTLEDQYKPEAMKKSLSQEMIIFAREAVTTGSTWESRLNLPVPLMGSLDLKQVHTLEGVKGDLAIVKYTGTLKPGKITGTAQDPQLAQMRQMVKMKGGKVEGTLEFDLDRGIAKKYTRKQTVTMNMMGQDISGTDITTIELVEFKAGE